MDVILLERVYNLGQIGDVVKVKPGYARNFLLPHKKALRATDANKAKFEAQRAQIEANNLERRTEAEQIRDRVDGLKVVLIRQAGETGQLFGSVTTRDIAEAVTGAGFTVERRQIILDHPIKLLGLHPVRVALHPEVIVTVSANVAKSTEEAEAQEKAGGFVGQVEETPADVDVLLAAAADTAGSAPAGEAEAKAEAETKGGDAKPKAERKAKGERKTKAKEDAEPEAEEKPKGKAKGEAKAKGKSKKG
ncbi:MAG TPA: 50S ribosomal protein L9 [Candidatus Udaeobacter sp.]|nr:50S ribosomal protein L9 [Candidatus Udaeobacter sp.]